MFARRAAAGERVEQHEQGEGDEEAEYAALQRGFAGRGAALRTRLLAVTGALLGTPPADPVPSPAGRTVAG